MNQYDELEIGLYDVSSGIQIVDIEDNYVIGVTADFDSACKKIDGYCENNGIDPNCIVIKGDYL